MKTADEIENKEIEEFLNFMKVASDICKEKGKIYEFKCPICKGKAQAIKNDYNGHLWAKCDSCNIKVIE